MVASLKSIFLELVTLPLVLTFDSDFILNQRINSDVIKVFDKRGPKQCQKLCSLHTDCNGVNYYQSELLCELVHIRAADQLEQRKGVKFSSFTTFKEVRWELCREFQTK